jgi:hypothetical protein
MAIRLRASLGLKGTENMALKEEMPSNKKALRETKKKALKAEKRNKKKLKEEKRKGLQRDKAQ